MPKPPTRTLALEVRRVGGEPRTISLDVRRAGGEPETINVTVWDPSHRSDLRLLELQTKNMRAIAERDALRELEQIRDKYAWIESFAEVWQEIDTYQGRPAGSCP